jgi:hypothetical protein
LEYEKNLGSYHCLYAYSISSLVYAGGDKNRGSKGQGSTGTNGKGDTTQMRGN